MATSPVRGYRAGEAGNGAVLLLIAAHQAGGRGIKRDGDLAFLAVVVFVAVLGAYEVDAIARQRATHRSGLDGLARRVADLGRGLGLAVEVADGQAPGIADLVGNGARWREEPAGPLKNRPKPASFITGIVVTPVPLLTGSAFAPSALPGTLEAPTGCGG